MMLTMKKTVYGTGNEDSVGPGCHGGNKDDAGLSSMIMVIMKTVMILTVVMMVVVVSFVDYRKCLKAAKEAKPVGVKNQ